MFGLNIFDMLGIGRYLSILLAGLSITLGGMLAFYIHKTNSQATEIGQLRHQLKSCDETNEIERHINNKSVLELERQCEEVKRYYESLPSKSGIIDRRGGAADAPDSGVLDLEKEAGPPKTAPKSQDK